MGCTDSKPAQPVKPKQQTKAPAHVVNKENNRTGVKAKTVNGGVKAGPVKPKKMPVEEEGDPAVSVASAWSDGGSVMSPTIATPRLLVPGRMVLYYHPMSQPCRSVLWYLNYSKRDCFPQIVDLIAGEHRSAKYLALRNAPQVPLLHDGDASTLTESSAILKYLTQTKEPSDATMVRYIAAPPTPESHALINQYIALHHSHVRKFTTEAFSLIFFSLPEARPAVTKQVQEAISPQLAVWDKTLQQHKFVVGDEMTICDFLFVPEVDQLHALGLVKDYPNLTAYIERMKEVEGYEKASEVFYETLKSMDMVR
eukprot:TRINITY_DN10885_c0_g1_i1.p1 TRINITY_DN10885_c0_g1~~TRINITY_DN10885_c0_g1_i1.p1  ORF type:complete len:326 (+),score=74.98 TRINITY_DN10885_c0_g1_i1:48-980(+)